MAISTSAWIGPAACSLRFAARPSQNWAIDRLELNTVGELTGPACYLWPIEVLRLSVPPRDKLWQVLQEIIPDIDKRGSKKSFLPSSTRGYLRFDLAQKKAKFIFALHTSLGARCGNYQSGNVSL